MLEDKAQEQAIKRVALSRHPKATGVKDIQRSDELDCWIVVLTTVQPFHYLLTLVTAEDIAS